MCRERRLISPLAGSGLHIIRALEHPRWEDYSYESLDVTRNRFHWYGHGGTVADIDPTRADRAFYMDNIDYPPSKHPFAFRWQRALTGISSSRISGELSRMDLAKVEMKKAIGAY